MAATLGREVEAKRWLRCAIWQGAVSSLIWVLWQSILSRKSDRTFWFLPSAWTCFRFVTFQVSQYLYLLGKVFVTTPQEKESASGLGFLSGVWKLTWKTLVGSSLEVDSAKQLSLKINATRDNVIFLSLCCLSGFLSLFALSSTQLDQPEAYDAGLRGAALGFSYGFSHLYLKKAVLLFPIIQRKFFFSLKMGIPQVISSSVKLAVVAVPVAEIFVSILGANTKLSINYVLENLWSLMWHQFVFVMGAICATACWEFCHHLIQVIQTRRHVFAPPLGSATAESQPTEQLLLMLEEADNRSLGQHLAYLDLCIVAESNVDTWRRTAFFEETGETYKRVIGACLRPLDNLTLRLVKGLEIFESDKSGDFLKQQMQAPGINKSSQGGSIKEIFRDFQLCSWCARTVASLTASSRMEDRYGVAQLSGCNNSVLSSLLSCLLAVEVYLGRRSSARGVGFLGPNSIKWTVPSQGTSTDVGRRKGFPFGKGSAMHKKAYALADVLRTSIYQIIAVFGEEMVVGAVGGKGLAIAERDWLSQKAPLYGTYEMHLQKLSLFLDYRVS